MAGVCPSLGSECWISWRSSVAAQDELGDEALDRRKVCVWLLKGTDREPSR